MSNVTIKLNKAGIGQLLKSEEMKEACEEVAKSQASADQHIKTFTGWQRAVAMIYPNTDEYS